MADTFDVVELDARGDHQVVFDFNNLAEFSIVADSLQITAPAKQPAMVASNRRYGGSKQVGETHENAMFSAAILVRGSSVDDTVALLTDALAVLERDPRNLFLRWIPDGASESVVSEIRSTGTWQLMPKWAQLTLVHSIAFQVSWQVAPLACGRPIAMTQWSGSLPAVIALDRKIPGNAPALAEVSITTGGGGDSQIWALLGWSPRPTAGLAPAPFGILEAETAGDLSGWRVDRTTVGTTSGDSCIRDTAANASKTYTASWPVDPARLVPDEFTAGTIDVEVWGRVLLGASLVAPTLILSARPEDGLAFGAARWTHEWGRLGRPLALPTGDAARRTRLGTVTFTVDPDRPRPWKLWIDGPVGAGSTGQWGIDNLTLVPVRARACSPSGVPGDQTFPRFVVSPLRTVKTIHADLTAHVGRPGTVGHPDHGLGGSLLEVPAGDVDLAVCLAGRVPDDPTPSAASEQLAYPARVDIAIVPRWHLVAAA